MSGIFELEFVGERAIAKCSKCYYVAGDTKNKHPAKGMSQRHNTLFCQCYKAAMDGSVDQAKNRGFLPGKAGFISII